MNEWMIPYVTFVQCIQAKLEQAEDESVVHIALLKQD